jgi:DNA sulfur modification protein DndB
MVDMSFGYSFPAIRGVQAGREYYTSMCPMRLIPKIFYYDEEEAELGPELRAQRTLNRQRLPELAKYITENKETYVFSALTASINGDMHFEPIGASGNANQIGVLKVPLDAKFIINDGQHRRAAIEMAVRAEPSLGDETIAVVFFRDRDLSRCQQMFADLNRHAVKPSKSIGILYDQRDELAELVRLVVLQSELLSDLVEMEKTSLAVRSRKLFTLSSIYQATGCLLEGMTDLSSERKVELAKQFWSTIAEAIPEWGSVHRREMSSGEVRSDFLHSHGIALHAMGLAGNLLIKKFPKNWPSKLRVVKDINWSRKNTKLWEGRAMAGGRVTKARQNLLLTTNVLKNHLKLELTPTEQQAEKEFKVNR